VAPDSRLYHLCSIAIKDQILCTYLDVLRIRFDSQYKGIWESVEKEDAGISDVGLQLHDNAGGTDRGNSLCKDCI
jgi:hypothetical protein